MSQVRLISVTEDAESLIAYCARVSNPSNQNNDNISKLILYCIKNAHWSIFEMAHLTVEINTSRAIAAQILRHRSFTFQEFSQRYADASLLSKEIPIPELRSQDLINRQNSKDDIDPIKRFRWEAYIQEHFSKSIELYKAMIDDGIAKECARFVLPLATPTRLYMSGNIRSWITYIALREKHGTQKEHMMIAKDCKKVFSEQFPVITESLGGVSNEWQLS